MESAMVKIEQVREEELEGFTNFVMGLIHQSGQVKVVILIFMDSQYYNTKSNL